MAMTAEQLTRERDAGENNEQKTESPGGRVDRSRSDRGRRAQREAAIRARRVGLVQICSAGAVLFCMALALIFLQSMTAAQGYELAQLRAELGEEQARTSQLEMEVASLQSSERIARIARDELGMIIPSGDEADGATGDAVIAGVGGDVQTASESGEDLPIELEEKTVLLQLQVPDEKPPLTLPQFADIGSWFLRWLRGGHPARADVIR